MLVSFQNPQKFLYKQEPKYNTPLLWLQITFPASLNNSYECLWLQMDWLGMDCDLKKKWG